jgi:protein phosphatase
MAGRNTYSAATDVGQDRELNEDCHGEFELADGGYLLVVCDGMGGHEGGEVASRIAVDAIGQIFQNSTAESPAQKLANGFRVANQRILAEAERADTEGMGTTAVAAYVNGNRFITAHVGDSRAYQVRGGKVVWQTRDHTRVQKMVEKGIITADEAKDHPDANVVTRALGYQQTADGEPIEADVEETPIKMKLGDTLVLCSDGLYDGVTDQEIADTVTGVEPLEAAQELVDFANRRGGHDNITVCVVRFDEPATTGKAADKESRGSVRTTDLDEPTPGRNTELEVPAVKPRAGSTKRAAVPTDEPEPEEVKRTFAALFMFAIAAVIVGLLVYLLVLRGGGEDKASPKPTPSEGAPPSGAHTPGDPMDTPGVLPSGGAGEAPPLPENPIVNDPARPRAPGATAPAGANPAPVAPSGPGGVGGSIPVPTGVTPPPAPNTKPAGTKPAGTKPGATKPATKPAATKPAGTKPPTAGPPGMTPPTSKPTIPSSKP